VYRFKFSGFKVGNCIFQFSGFSHGVVVYVTPVLYRNIYSYKELNLKMNICLKRIRKKAVMV
jgi:hypothetical protein